MKKSASRLWNRILSGFGLLVPADVRTQLTFLQHERLCALIPVLYLTIAINTIAGALAAQGDFPLVYQLIFPSLLFAASVWRIFTWRSRRSQTVTLERARREMRNTFIATIGMSLLGGLWSVGAFYETHETRRVLAAIFMILSAFASANCLASFPRAAIAAIVAGLTPITLAMLGTDDLGLRAMGISVVVVSSLQVRLVFSKFNETVKSLVLQNSMKKLAETDALTGLANRRAFEAALEDAVRGAPGRTGFSVAMLDLDGFKPANDEFGHAAGDVILVEVAARMRQLAGPADCVARIGGDEFGIVFSGETAALLAEERIAAMRALLSLPYEVGSAVIMISASAGLARYPENGCTMDALLRAADQALYIEKAGRREARRVAQAA